MLLILIIWWSSLKLSVDTRTGKKPEVEVRVQYESEKKKRKDANHWKWHIRY